MNTTISFPWSVYVWREGEWRLHHTYPSELAAENAAAVLQNNGFLVFIGA